MALKNSQGNRWYVVADYQQSVTSANLTPDLKCKAIWLYVLIK